MSNPAVAPAQAGGDDARSFLLAPRRRSGAQIGLLVAGLIALALLPFAITSNYQMHLVNFVGIFAIVAFGLNFILGFTGQLSIAQAAFFGIGAYASALVTVRLGAGFWIGFLAAGLVAFLVALVIGPLTRLRDIFFAVATLVFGEAVRLVAVNWVGFTNGPNGITGVPRASLFGFVFRTEFQFYYLILAVLVIQFVLTVRLTRSRVGRAMVAIRFDETACTSLGIHVARYKTLAFAFACMFAGLAGSLYVHLVRFISPESLTFFRSVEIIVMVVVGGMGSLAGPYLGAAVVVLAPEYARVLNEYRIVVFSAAIIVMLLVAPRGLAGILESVTSGTTRAARAIVQGVRR